MIVEAGGISAAQLFRKTNEMLDVFEQGGAAKKISEGVRAKLAKLCGLAEILNEEFGVELIRVSCEEAPTIITMVIDVDELVFKNGRSHSFFEHIKSADVLSFAKSSDGGISVKLGVFL